MRLEPWQEMRLEKSKGRSQDADLRQREAWRSRCAGPTKDGSEPGGAERGRPWRVPAVSPAALSIDAPSTLPNYNLLALALLLAKLTVI